MEKKVFDIKNEHMPRGAWWWWFWLFFFDNPKNPEKPRQLMILWSTKNERLITCNDLKIQVKDHQDRSKLNGAVAAWYFDGEKMHHNFLLDHCDISIADDRLSTNSAIPTSFTAKSGINTVKIGDKMKFIAERKLNHEFAIPTYHSNTFFRNTGYSILRFNHLDLTGLVNGKKIKGSAYFQRVFVNAPSPGWYWGIFHFDNGGILTYFNPQVLGRSIKKDVTFFDGKKLHKFKDINVRVLKGSLPSYEITAMDSEKKIKFTVSPYSHSSWTFRKRSLGIIPNKLVYNEYPATISSLELETKTGRVSLKDLGKSIGNAEHSTGLLL